MKRRIYALAVIVLIVIAGVIIFEVSKSTTFDKIVLERLNGNEISSITLLRTLDDNREEEISITDPNGIKKVVHYFSQMKLKEKKSRPSVDYTEQYRIIIRTDEKRRFGITLYDNNYLSVYDYNATLRGISSYEITNKIDDPSVIPDLFNK